jgi:hypothetical protein
MRAVLFIFSSTAAATAATAVEEGGVEDDVDMMTIRTKDVVVEWALLFVRVHVKSKMTKKETEKTPLPAGALSNRSDRRSMLSVWMER